MSFQAATENRFRCLTNLYLQYAHDVSHAFLFAISSSPPTLPSSSFSGEDSLNYGAMQESFLVAFADYSQDIAIATTCIPKEHTTVGLPISDSDQVSAKSMIIQ